MSIVSGRQLPKDDRRKLPWETKQKQSLLVHRVWYVMDVTDTIEMSKAIQRSQVFASISYTNVL